MTTLAYGLAAKAIVWREMLRFVHQRERFLSALVRPLIWLIAFGAGFRGILGLPVQAPYPTYVSYEVYMVPGLIAMIQLFNGMQSSLSMVYDREMGSMRVLLTAPLPRPAILAVKLMAGTLVSVFQVYAFLAVAAAFGIVAPTAGYLTLMPALLLTGMMFGAVGMLLSSTVRQLENFAGVMNFVIFPAFFFSSALYPIWKMRENSEVIAWVCLVNPFTHAVEFLRFSLYATMNWTMLTLVLCVFAVTFLLAVRGYDPGKGLRTKGRAG
ncbi:ABC transporter permease [Mongoliimonas terrestris]|uniref:ABC transporter permease n=1 Tax=Mongoliimonas terrestris TaxID=1709001 RepID=UPI0009495A9B|nr:ABC transporter permease [Mongoliimonas terrestris]